MFCRRKGSGENISKRTIAPFSSISFMGAIITIAIGSIKSYFFEYIKSFMLVWVGWLLPYSSEVVAITPVTSPEQHFHFQVLTHLTTTRVVAECLQLSMRKLVRILTDRMLFLMPNPPFGLVHYLLMGRQWSSSVLCESQKIDSVLCECKKLLVSIPALNWIIDHPSPPRNPVFWSWINIILIGGRWRERVVVEGYERPGRNVWMRIWKFGVWNQRWHKIVRSHCGGGAFMEPVQFLQAGKNSR